MNQASLAFVASCGEGIEDSPAIRLASKRVFRNVLCSACVSGDLVTIVKGKV